MKNGLLQAGTGVLRPLTLNPRMNQFLVRIERLEKDFGQPVVENVSQVSWTVLVTSILLGRDQPCFLKRIDKRGTHIRSAEQCIDLLAELVPK